MPVINGLTNEYHPCQILADIFTYIEHRGPIQGKTVAWVGDGNNMAATWLQAAAILGFHLRVSTPRGYEVNEKWPLAPWNGAGSYKTYSNPMEACQGADLVTTDVWTSMGFEAEKRSAPRSALPNGASAPDDGRRQPRRTVHALPARPPRRRSAGRSHRRPQSVVWDEAENRMHVQRHHGVPLLGRSSMTCLADGTVRRRLTIARRACYAM